MKALEAATHKLMRVCEEIDYVFPLLNNLKIGEGSAEENRKLGQAIYALIAVRHLLNFMTGSAHARYLEIQLNTNPTWRPKDENNEGKKRWAAKWNDALRDANLSIQNPENGEPCILYVVGSRDKEGRYVLESRVTGKRSHASRSLTELMPVRLIPTKEEAMDDLA